MLVASLVVETLPGKATTVVERMGRISGMGPIAGDGDHRITAEWKVPESDNPEGLSEVLRAMNPNAESRSGTRTTSRPPGLSQREKLSRTWAAPSTCSRT